MPKINILSISILTNLGLFAVYFFIFKLFYVSPNDSLMEFTAAGTVVFNTPSEFLIYTHVWIGKLLTLLYHFFSKVQWYPLYLLLSSFLGNTLLLYSLLICKGFSKLNYCLFIGYFLLVGNYFFSEFQYTTVAFQVALGGLMLFLSFQETNQFENQKLSILLPIIVCLWASAIRPLAMILVLIIAVPVFLSDGIFKKARQKNIIIFLSLTVGLFIILNYANIMSYQLASGWDEILEYDRYKRWLNDFAGTNFNDPIRLKALQSVGWSINDLNMFQSWFFADSNLYSLKNLKTLTSQLPLSRSDLNLLFLIKSYLQVLLNSLNLIIFVIIFCLITLKMVSKEGTIKIALVAGWLLPIMGILIASAKLPAHVYVPMIAFLGFLTIWVTNEQYKFKNWKQFIILIILSMTILIYLINLVKVDRVRYLNSQKLKSAIAQINPQPEEVFISWGAAFPYTSLSPFTNFHQTYSNLNLIHLGTPTMTPLFWDRLREFGITDNLYKELRDRDDLFLIIQTALLNKNQQIYQKFMQEHYQSNVNFKIRYQDDKFTVVSIVEKN